MVAPEKGEAASFKADFSVSRNTFPTLPGGAGAISSNAHNLAEFFNALFQFRYLKPDQVAYMKRIQDGFGAGLLDVPYRKKLVLGHNGAIDEFRAAAGYAPDSTLSFALLTNLSSDEMNEVLLMMMDECYNISWKMPKSISMLSDADIAAIAGEFTSASLPISIKLSGNRGRLVGQASGQDAFPLLPTEGDINRYKFNLADITIDLKRDNSGKVVGFRFRQGSNDFDFKRK